MGNYVLVLGAVGSSERAIVGGKGASLGRLVAAGFPVPPGFTVCTDAYLAFLEKHGLRQEIATVLERLDIDDVTSLDSETARIRELIASAELPAEVSEAIAEAHKALIDEAGSTLQVAVRSSGTAEDMAEASFAGLHDTYLNVGSLDDVIDAVRKCWASMWTSRATSYRQRQGLDHLDSSIAVVVQQMIDSEVAGVLFTANPLTSQVDNMVVNAAWGLGEGIVSGLVTPDEYRIDAGTLEIREKTLGTKLIEIVRNPETGVGTVSLPTDVTRQGRFTLDPDQIAELAKLGREVELYYGGIPQDIEWGYADGRFYLLQSRDITGVEFTWDEHINHDAWGRKDDGQHLFTYAYAEEYWTGAVTPLFYSLRAEAGHAKAWDHMEKLWDFGDLAQGNPWLMYHKGAVFWNATIEAKYLSAGYPKTLQPLVSSRIPDQLKSWMEDQPFSALKFLKMQARVHLLEPDAGITRWMKFAYQWINEPEKVDRIRRFDREKLRIQSDQELLESWREIFWIKYEWGKHNAAGFFGYGPLLLSTLQTLLDRWYRGSNPNVFHDLLTGLPTNKMSEEQTAKWELGQMLRNSTNLQEHFRNSEPADFFATVGKIEGGQEFKAKYDTFLAQYGHRGHADRDIYYDRRRENPSLDYNALRIFIDGDDSVSPEEMERKLIQRRTGVLDEVIADVSRRPFGQVKVEAIKWLADYAISYLTFREDQRWIADLIALSKKWVIGEVGRRLVERGVLQNHDDHYFLSKTELLDLFAGQPPTRQTALKIVNRRKAFERLLRREVYPPRYLQGGLPVAVDDEAAGGTGLHGAGISPGTVTGRARIVPNLNDINRVQKGDLLICNATDPGWSAVFMIIRGLVMETGGMLAHGACLSREYGIPAVQLAQAMQRIPDGALITVSGDTGEIVVLAETGQE